MASTVISKRLISSEEYHKMEETGMLKPNEKVELINGEIYNMSPIGSKHASIVEQMVELWIPTFTGNAILRIQNPVHIDQWNEPEPDLAILAYRQDRYNMAHPEPADVLAVIEVSDTTYEYDKNVKLPIYASSRIPIYWIVNLTKEVIEVYSNPRRNQYDVRVLYHPGDEISLLGNIFEVSEILIL